MELHEIDGTTYKLIKCLPHDAREGGLCEGCIFNYASPVNNMSACNIPENITCSLRDGSEGIFVRSIKEILKKL